MAWSITAAQYPALPGALALTVVGDANAAVEIRRLDALGYHLVRNVTTLPPSGLLQVVDPEAPLGRPVTYQVSSGGVVRATSNTITAPPLPDGRALLRSVLRPGVQYLPVTFVAETDTQYPTSSTAFPVVGSPDLVVVGDIRRARQGTYTFAATSIEEANSLLLMLRDGIPFLLRLCPHGQVIVRDTLFYALSVREEVWGGTGKRIIVVDYQAVDYVGGDTDVPPAGSWTWGNLKTQTTAPTWGHLPAKRATWLDLALTPITP